MNRSSSLLVLALASAVTLCLPPSGLQAQTYPDDLIQIRSEPYSLGVFDGELRFRGPFMPGAAKPDLLVKVRSLLFHDFSVHPRVFIKPTEKGKLPAQDSQDGAYLTADYSTTPPRVMLTKKPERYSQWKVEYTYRGGESGGATGYIRNVNDMGKDAWLYWEQDGKRVLLGGSSVCTLHRPILSFDKKVNFDVSPYNPRGDGK